jgi:hypothetical protein
MVKSLVFVVLFGAMLVLGATAQKDAPAKRWQVSWKDGSVTTYVADVWWKGAVLEIDSKYKFEKQYGRDDTTKTLAWYVDFFRDGDARGIYAIPGKAPIAKEVGYMIIAPK